MRWLMIGLLVSLAALLTAAAGLARHIRVQHARLRREPPARIDTHTHEIETHDSDIES